MNATFWKTKRIREGKAWILKLACSLAMKAKLPPGMVPPPGVRFSGGRRFPIAISIVDREPWRCRRTDGKKWRCHKDVVPTCRYCDRHINRGRKRSRKSTEEGSPPADAGLQTPTPTPLGMEVSAGNQSQCSSSTTSFIFIPVRAEPQHPPSFTNTSNGPAASHLGTKITGSTVNNMDVLSHENPTTENVDVQVTVRNKESSRGIFKLECIHDNDPGRKNYCSSSMMNSKDLINRGGSTSLNKHNTLHSCASQWLAFSPRTVLQARGCGASSFDGGDTGLEPERCRRTDGKKWRCGRQVVTNSKYCGMHFRGGVRNYLEAAQPRPGPASSGNASSAAVPPTVSLPKKATGHPRLSTNLSISIPGSPSSSRSELLNGQSILLPSRWSTYTEFCDHFICWEHLRSS